MIKNEEIFFSCKNYWPPNNKNHTDQNLNSKTMPQLVPFFFINEITATALVLSALIYLASKYILPKTLRLYTTRIFLSKI